MIVNRWCHFPQEIDSFKFFDFKKSIEADWDFSSLQNLSEKDLCFARFVDSQPVSFVVGRKSEYNYKIAFEVHFISTDCKYRSNGFMKALWADFVKHLSHKGYDFVLLEVHEKNHKAISFYFKSGFSILKNRENYYKDGAKALELKLDI
jgi:ribosomal protein S18 acetylase RimI-like enzyme